VSMFVIILGATTKFTFLFYLPYIVLFLLVLNGMRLKKNSFDTNANNKKAKDVEEISS
jgi:uncharacterized membrane protein